MLSSKTYNSTNFFKYTYCEFQQVDYFDFPENSSYKSKSESMYLYNKKGVYRKSNHWGRVANCRWKLITKDTYKNQKLVIAFAKWEDFLPINSSDKIFFIDVNFDLKTAKIQPKNDISTQHFFTYSEAQKRLKQITNLFKDDKWAKYFDLKIDDLQFQIITEFINSDKTLEEIKRSFK